MIARFDQQADALYIEVAPRLVARTVEFDPGTMLDVDEAGTLIGIEIIRPARDWHLQAILDRYPINEDDTLQLLSIWQRGSSDPWFYEGAARSAGSNASPLAATT